MKMRELAIVATAGIAVSCSANSAPEISHLDMTPPPTTYSMTPQEQYKQEVDALPHSVCSVDRQGKMNAQEVAAKCLEAQQRGRIALVDFAEEPTLLEAIAKDITPVMSAATDGVITPTAIVVTASPEAKALYEKMNPDCAIYETEFFASIAADVKMPQLQKEFDFVVAVTDKNPCQDIGGVTDQVVGRQADIYLSTFERSSGDPASYENFKKRVTGTIVHETGHLYGANHQEKLDCQINNGGTYHNLEAQNIAPAPNIFDVKRYAKPAGKSCLHQEYNRSPNLMMGSRGENRASLDFKPNSLEIERFKKLASPSEEPILATPISETVTTFDAQSAKAHKYASIELPTGSGFSLLNSKNEATQITEVSFVPLQGNDNVGADPAVTGVQMYLEGYYHEVIDLGPLAKVAPGESKTMLVSVGREVVRIVLDGSTMAVGLAK